LRRWFIRLARGQGLTAQSGDAAKRQEKNSNSEPSVSYYKYHKSNYNRREPIRQPETILCADALRKRASSIIKRITEIKTQILCRPFKDF